MWSPSKICPGPLVFLLYINDLTNSVPGRKINLFADDTNIFASVKTMNKLESKANSYILNLNNWLKANKLHLNIDKTCYSVFTPNKTSLPTVTIRFMIPCFKECKYLGVIIDDKLKWTSHIEFILQKLKRLLGTLYKMHYNLTDWCFKTFILHLYIDICYTVCVW